MKGSSLWRGEDTKLHAGHDNEAGREAGCWAGGWMQCCAGFKFMNCTGTVHEYG